jgi:hypothetical protein
MPPMHGSEFYRNKEAVYHPDTIYSLRPRNVLSEFKSIFWI